MQGKTVSLCWGSVVVPSAVFGTAAAIISMEPYRAGPPSNGVIDGISSGRSPNGLEIA